MGRKVCLGKGKGSVEEGLNYIIKEGIVLEVGSLVWKIKKGKSEEIWKI